MPPLGNSRRLRLLIVALITITLLYIIYTLNVNSSDPVSYDGFRLIEHPPSETGIIKIVHRQHRVLFQLPLRYRIKSTLCTSRRNVLAVILVTSYFGNVETRSAMRRSATDEDLAKLNMVRVFLLADGAAGDKYTTQKAVEDEADRFGDIVQGEFREAYKNLTYKHLMGLAWAIDECPQTKFVIKMDDDIVVDMSKIMPLLRDVHMPGAASKLLAGYIMDNMKPIRLRQNKWFVSTDEYVPDVYPVFLSGWFYVTNTLTIAQLLGAHAHHPYFWIDDLFVTGILAQELGIKHYRLNNLYTPHPEFLRCCMHDTEIYGYSCPYIVGPNGGDSGMFFTFNNVMQRCALKRCAARPNLLNDTCVAERQKVIPDHGDAKIETYRLV